MSGQGGLRMWGGWPCSAAGAHSSSPPFPRSGSKRLHDHCACMHPGAGGTHPAEAGGDLAQAAGHHLAVSRGCQEDGVRAAPGAVVCHQHHQRLAGRAAALRRVAALHLQAHAASALHARGKGAGGRIHRCQPAKWPLLLWQVAIAAGALRWCVALRVQAGRQRTEGGCVCCVQDFLRPGGWRRRGNFKRASAACSTRSLLIPSAHRAKAQLPQRALLPAFVLGSPTLNQQQGAEQSTQPPELRCPQHGHAETARAAPRHSKTFAGLLPVASEYLWVRTQGCGLD